MPITVPTRYSKDQLFAALHADEHNLGKKTLKKAEEGKDSAFFEIGQSYLLRKENEKALGWFVMAAEHDHAGAFGKIGNMYFRGTGVKVNYRAAMEFYLKAAKRGDRSAYGSISTMFGKGLGVQVDKRLAAEWYHRSDSDHGIYLTYSKSEFHQLSITRTLKSVDELLVETKVALKEHQIKEQMQLDIERLQLEKKEMKNEIQSLKEKNLTIEQQMQAMMLTFQEEMRTMHDRVNALESRNHSSLLESDDTGFENNFKQQQDRGFESPSRNASIALARQNSANTDRLGNSENNVAFQDNNDLNYDSDSSTEDEDNDNNDLNYDGK